MDMIDSTTLTYATIFLTSLIGFGPTPSALINSLITLPILLHLTRPGQGKRDVAIVYGLVAVASFVAYLPRTMYMLPVFQSVLLQVVFSMVSAGFVVLPLIAWRILQERLVRTKHQEEIEEESGSGGPYQDDGRSRSRSTWLAIAGFPVIWMTEWLIFEQINPFGRQGSPTGSISTLPIILQPILRHTGQPGIDFLSASWSVLIARISTVISDNPTVTSQIYTQQRQREDERRRVSLGRGIPGHKSVDLIGFEDESRAEGSLATSSLGGGSRVDQVLAEETQPSSRRSSHGYGTLSAMLGRRLSKAAQPAFLDLFDGAYRAFVVIVLLMTVLPGLVVPITAPLSLSEPLERMTPISVGCVLPQSQTRHPHQHLTLDDYIRETEQLASHAKVLLWPEQALHLRTEQERQEVLRQVQGVAARYGIWVGVGLGSPPRASPVEHDDGDAESIKRRNELVLIGPHGTIGEYSKRALVPLVESYGHLPGSEAAPVWTIPLPPPRVVTKPDWADGAPYEREVGVMPLICLDAFHPSISSSPALVSDGERHREVARTPALILLATSPPSARNGAIPSMILDHAKDLAVQHSAQVLICDGSGAEAISGLVEVDGSVRYRQRGEGGFVVKSGVPCRRDGERRSGWEVLGSLGVWGIIAAVVALGAIVELMSQRFGQADYNLRGGWSGLATRIKRALGKRGEDAESERLIDTE